MYKSFSLLLSVLLIVSCDKDKDDQQVVPNVTQIRFGTHGFQTIEHIDFSYDNLNRVSTMFLYSGDSGRVVPSGDSLVKVSYVYNGNSMLPNLIDYNIYHQGERILHYLTYGSDGKLIRDSLRNTIHNESQTVDYSYSGNLMIVKRNESALVDTVDMTGGNIMWQSSKSMGYYHKSYFEYDNRINPLNKMNIAPIFHVLCGDVRTFWHLWTPVTKNNLTRTSGAIGDSHINYVYNEKNLPAKSLRYSGTSIYADTLTYKY